MKEIKQKEAGIGPFFKKNKLKIKSNQFSATQSLSVLDFLTLAWDFQIAL